MPNPTGINREDIQRRKNEDIETRVALVERDILQLAPLSDKLSEAIDKLIDIANTLKQIGAVHEAKLIEFDKINIQQNELIKENKESNEELKIKVAKLENWRYYTLGIVAALLAALNAAFQIFHLK